MGIYSLKIKKLDSQSEEVIANMILVNSNILSDNIPIIIEDIFNNNGLDTIYNVCVILEFQIRYR